MNYKTFRLNDELIYTMSLAAYYIKALNHYNTHSEISIYFLSSLGRLGFYRINNADNKVMSFITDKIERNPYGGGYIMLNRFYFNCEKGRLFVWL